MKEVAISTRDLKIWYVLDGMSADQIAEQINMNHGINCSGDAVEKLIRDRKIQTRNVKRSEPTYVFTNPDDQPNEVQNVNENLYSLTN